MVIIIGILVTSLVIVVDKAFQRITANNTLPRKTAMYIVRSSNTKKTGVKSNTKHHQFAPNVTQRFSTGIKLLYTSVVT